MFKRLLMTFALVSIPALAMADEVVRYQLADWKAKHIHDEKKAESIVITLKKLGCEVKKHSHDGHIDVMYRCPKWRQLELDSHDEAHKWESWLKEFEFQTEHKH
jgi:hypothetical protein